MSEFGLRYEFEHWWTMLKGLHQQLGRSHGTTFEEREAMRAGGNKAKKEE